MNRLFLCCTSIFLFSSCQNTSEMKESKNKLMFMGDFSGEPMQLILEQVDDTLVKGESHHKGQKSITKGSRKASKRGYSYSMKELGNSAFEGIFNFEFDTATNTITGVWLPLDTAQNYSVQYTLSKVKKLCH